MQVHSLAAQNAEHVTRQDNGSLRLNFKPLKVDENFSFERYVLGVYNEVYFALCGLVEK